MDAAAATAGRSEPVDLSTVADFHLGALTIRPATREVVHAGVSEILEPRVMQVLVALAQGQDQVVSRERLIARCWGGRIVSEDAINTCMTKVRRLGETFDAYDIQTVPRVGYRPPLVQRCSCRRAAGSPSFRLNRTVAATVVIGLMLATLVGGLAVWGLVAPTSFNVAIVPFEFGPAAAPFAKQVDDNLIGSP